MNLVKTIAVSPGDLGNPQDDPARWLIEDMCRRYGWPTGEKSLLRPYLIEKRYKAFLNWTESGPTPHLLMPAPQGESEEEKAFKAEGISLPEGAGVQAGAILKLLQTVAGLNEALTVDVGFVYPLGAGDVAVTPTFFGTYKKMVRRPDLIRESVSDSSLQDLANQRSQVKAWQTASGEEVPELVLTATAAGKLTTVPAKGWERLGVVVAYGANCPWFLGLTYDLVPGISASVGYGKFDRQVRSEGDADTRGTLGFSVQGDLADIVDLFH
jgi:hypothetical protein